MKLHILIFNSLCFHLQNMQKWIEFEHVNGLKFVLSTLKAVLKLIQPVGYTNIENQSSQVHSYIEVYRNNNKHN